MPELVPAPWLRQDDALPLSTPPTAPEEPETKLTPAPWLKPAEPTLTPAPWLEKPPENGPMPGPLDAAWAGLKHSLTDISQGTEVAQGQKPTPDTAETNPAAQSYNWQDLEHFYSRGLPKTMYRLAESSPTLAAGVLGGIAGSAVSPGLGTAIGGAGGAAVGAALQAIGPTFAAELKKSPNDPEGAWDRSVKSTVVSGLASGASWAAFGSLKMFNGPLKQLAFQAFGVQPAINVAAQTAKDVATGESPTFEKSWEAAKEGAIGTVVPAVGHALLTGRFGEPQTKSAIPTPAESAAKAQTLRNGALDAMIEANTTPHLHVRDKMLQRADDLKSAADYEEDRYTAPFFAKQKVQQAEALEAKAAAEPDKVISQMYTDMASEQRRSAGHDLWISKLAPPLEKPVGPLAKMKQYYLNNIDPSMTSEHALQAESVMRAYKASQNYIDESLNHFAKVSYRQKWNDEVPFTDQLRFLEAYQSGLPVPQDLQTKYPWTLKAEPEYRKQLKDTYDEEVAMGSKAHFLENYMSGFWKDQVKAEKLFAPQQLQQSMGDTWFQKSKTYDLIQHGIDNGLEPKYENIQDIVTARRRAGGDMIEKMKMLRSLQEMGLATPTAEAPAHIKNPNITGDPYEWQPINAPDRQQWMIAPDIQPMWENAIKSKGLWGDPGTMGDVFRGYMAVKAYWVPIKLALSAFHFVHVAHINAVNNMSRALVEAFGSPISGQQSLMDRFRAIPEAMLQSVADPFFRAMPYMPFKGKDIMRAFETTKENQTPQQAFYTKMMTEGGMAAHLSYPLRMKGEQAFWDAVGQNRYLNAMFYDPKTGTVMAGPGLAYKKTMGAMFEKWIPSLKTAAYMREAEALFRRRPDLITDDVNRKVALSAIGKQVDGRFGEMFYGGLFWNRTLKDAAIGSFLSLGWNLGFIKEFGGGAFQHIARRAMDAPNPTRALVRETTNKTMNMFLYGLTAAVINAAMTKGMSGEDPTGLDLIFPRIGGLNPDGSPRRITNAFYTREVPMAMKNIQERQSVLGGLSQMMYHKMMFAPFAEMWNNKDYWGNEIYNENSGTFQRSVQLAQHLFGNELNPMSVSGAKRALQLSGKPHDTMDVLKQLTDRDVYMPLAGFGPAPTYASASPLQNRLGYLYKEHVNPQSNSFEVAEIMKKRAEARTEYMGAMQRGDQDAKMAAALKLRNLGMVTKEINKIKPGGADLYRFQRLNSLDKISLMKTMTPEEFKTFFPVYRGKKPTSQLDPEIVKLWQKYNATKSGLETAPWLR